MKNSCAKAIEDRKSVRFYSDKQVSDEVIMQVLDAARLAPSAKNVQPWRFRVLSQEEVDKVVNLLREELFRDNSEPSGLDSARIMGEASKVVMVFMEHKPLVEAGKNLVPYYLSMGASIENALIRATELGIGSLWIYDSVVIQEALTKMFFPEGMFISTLVFGYERGTHPKAKKKSMDEILIKGGKR